MGAGRVRARRGIGTIRVRDGRLLAQVSRSSDASGRRGKNFDNRTQAEAWIATQQLEHRQLANPVTDDRLADYLRWWIAVEDPKGKPGRRPLARSTLAQYLVVVEHHLIPELGHRKVGQLTVRELDAFANRKLAAGDAPATVNRMRETLRSALSTAVRQDRLIRNVARYGSGIAAARAPVDRFTDHERLRTAGDLSPYFRDEVVANAHVLYDAAWRVAEPYSGRVSARNSAGLRMATSPQRPRLSR